MTTGFKRVILSLASAFLIMVMPGCAGPAKKPPAPALPPTPPTLEMAEFRQLADKLSNEAIRVQGVDNATVILQGTGKRINAIVGVTVNQGISKARQNEIKAEVKRRLRQADPRIKGVQVTTDPKQVQTIKNIAKAVAEGKPVSQLQGRINDISRRIGS